MIAMSVHLSNVDVHLIDEGSGPPTLFLHGNPDTGEMWRGVISRLRGRLRCLAPDLPGFGRSPVTGAFDCRLESMARFVDELVTAIGAAPPINLAVHDFGGPYGLSWAVRHPQKVRRIAITNALYFADYEWHFWGRVWRTPVLGELSMAWMNRWIFARELERGGPRLDRDHVRATWARITPAMKRMVLQLYRATGPESFEGWEDAMLDLTAAVPTRVFWGMRDPYIPARYAERFGTGVIRYFPDCGHWVPVEAAAELAADLADFFA